MLYLLILGHQDYNDEEDEWDRERDWSGIWVQALHTVDPSSILTTIWSLNIWTQPWMRALIFFHSTNGSESGDL